MPTYFDHLSGKVVEYQRPKTEFRVYVSTNWDKTQKGVVLGYRLEIDCYVWRDSKFGLKWRELSWDCKWDMPFGPNGIVKALLFKRIVKRFIAVYSKLPDLHATAMRLRAL
jgi:hypothetical protein